ncbi:hypothetical protein AURDEDRAFT_116808 [Auricularia subglabra TFB-10046 SS5]|uniref:Transmembrane protein n=1 Tax=Auricularia subglabra (strain TFB-10046 / SS5) TaxID=717982 RepID=J0WU84_AURST|nr:hypothetical protein AURDEDRAFT_116808 [Auricularia subglabra TFB-10046 SS5]
MHSRVFSLVLAVLTFGLFAAASPLSGDLQAREMEKRASAVVGIVNKLSSDVNGALNGFDATADAGPNIDAITKAFFAAANSLTFVGPVALSSAEQNAVAKTVAGVINTSAGHIGKCPKSIGVITATVLLDVQIRLFLNIFGIVSVGVLGLVANLVVNLQLLLSIHLTIVANIFINILGIVIVL